MKTNVLQSFKKSLLTLLLLFGGFGAINGQILTFEFSGLAGNEATANSNFNNAGLNTSTISRGAGLTASNNGGRFNATSWAIVSIANAVSGNNYMEFTITPNGSNQFSVSTIDIQLQRSSAGNSALALRSSVDAYATDLDGEKAVIDNTTTQTFTFTINQTNSSAAVSYRLYSYAETAVGSGGPGDGIGNDITVNGTVSSSLNPSVTLSSPAQVSAANVNRGAANHILSAFRAAVADADALLNQVSFVSAGTYSAASDLSNYRLWYNSADNFGAASNLATIGTGVATSGTVTFTSLSQTILENATGYFWITVDVAASAAAGNTLFAATHILTFGSGSSSGSIADGNAQTIQSVTPTLVLSSPSPAVVASTFDQNTTNNLIYRFDLAITAANTALTTIDITTTGNYAANGVSNLKAWYSTDAAFDAVSDVLLTTIAAPTLAGVQAFSGFNQALLSGNTSYLFVTVDVSCVVVPAATIGVDALTTANFTTTASASGSASASGTHSFTETTPNNSTALATNIANQSITISWTNPTACYGEIMIIAKASSTIAGTPTGDGSAYTAALDFAGAGTPFDGGKVVYKGSTSSQTITGLTNGTPYFVRIFTRNGATWSAGSEVNATPANIVTVNADDAGKWAQGSAAFTSYANHSYTDGVATLQGTQVIRNTTSAQDAFAGALGTYSFRLQDAVGSKLVTTISSGGVNTFSFDIRRWDATPDPDYTLHYSVNGGSSYTTAATINNAALDGTSNWKTFSGTINSPFNNILIEILRNNGERVLVDNFFYSPRAFEITTWNGSAWSNGTPDATKNAIMSGNIAISAGFTANNLTIDNGFTATLDAGQDLTVNGTLQNNGTLNIADNALTLAGTYGGTGSIRSNGGDLVLNGTGNAGSLSFDQTTDGTTNLLANLTLNRTSSGEVTLSNKLNISNQVVLTNGIINTAGFLHLNSTSATATATVVGGTNASINGSVTAARFLPRASANNNGFRFVSHPMSSNPVINTVGNLPTANNTLVGYNEGANAYTGINDRTATWSQAIGYGVWTNAINTLSFTGALQLSDVSAVSMGNANNRWNFAGNPFPSTIDWEALTTVDMQNAVWVWVKDDVAEGGGAWASYIGGVSANGGSRYIAPLQGFIVRALNPGTPSIAYPAAARISNQTPTFQRIQIIGDLYRIKITKTANNSTMETVLRFRPMASETHDAAYDAEFMSDFANATPDLYTTDNNGVKYSINALPVIGATPVLVPLQVETFGAGDYSFTFDASQLVSGVSVQLEDAKNSTFANLVDGQVLTFTAAANDAVNRFRLHFNGLATSVTSSNLDLIQMYVHAGALYIRGTERAESLRILDISGRTVYSVQQLELDGNAIRPNLAKGTYLVQLVNEIGVKTVKVIF